MRATSRGLSPWVAEGTATQGRSAGRHPGRQGRDTPSVRGRSAGALTVNGIATRVFGRDHGLPDPLAGRALSPQAVEGTTARGRLRSQARPLVAHSVPTPTQDFGRGRASSPGQGKEDFASELPWGIRPVFFSKRLTQSAQSQQQARSSATPDSKPTLNGVLRCIRDSRPSRFTQPPDSGRSRVGRSFTRRAHRQLPRVDSRTFQSCPGYGPVIGLARTKLS